MMRREVHFALLALIVFLMQTMASNETNLSRQEILRKYLHEDAYDSSIPPNFEQNIPTLIQVQLTLLNIHSVSETSMEYSVDIYLRQQWEDSRLAFGDMTSHDRLELDNKVMDKVWTPDTFFVNEKQAFIHNVTIPNKLLHLHRNGTILYSMRVSLALTCHMLLEKYPLDKQRCSIIIESYAYTVGNIVYYWKTDEPVEVFSSVEMPKFEPNTQVTTSDCTRNYSSRRFSCIKAEIILQRKVGYYVVQIFIPSVLIVVLSWVGFWVDYDAVPARVSLGIMTVLTMTTQSSGAKQNLPYVSYIKAIDVWMATCLMFVFASLLEYAYVNVLARRSPPLVVCNGKGITADTEKQCSIVTESEHARLKQDARRVDKISRLVFPVLFALFNLIFWLYYIFSPDP